MTKLLYPLNLDLYAITYTINGSQVTAFGIGRYRQEEIETQGQALAILSVGLRWRVDILEK